MFIHTHIYIICTLYKYIHIVYNINNSYISYIDIYIYYLYTITFHLWFYSFTWEQLITSLAVDKKVSTDRLGGISLLLRQGLKSMLEEQYFKSFSAIKIGNNIEIPQYE